MAVPILLTAILLAYGVLNIPLTNQCASPFIAVILICFVWIYWRDSQKREDDRLKYEKEIDEMQLSLLKQEKLLEDLKKAIQEDKNDKDGNSAACKK